MTLERRCPACTTAFKPDAVFCAACGRRRASLGGGVAFAIQLYLALLAVQGACLVWARLGGKPAEIIAVGTVGLATLTLGVAAAKWDLVAPAYKRAGLGIAGWALVVVAAPVIMLAVALCVDAISHATGMPQLPLETGGLAATVLTAVVAAPLFEELAFRGLIYGALVGRMRRSEVYAISAFAFALLHLSVPMLLTHVPLGLYLCWLRERSGSLWPPTLAHFCHNLLVLLAERHGWP